MTPGQRTLAARRRSRIGVGTVGVRVAEADDGPGHACPLLLNRSMRNMLDVVTGTAVEREVGRDLADHAGELEAVAAAG